MKHLCHAEHCSKEVPPKLLMCYRHWKMVPADLQILVWRYYRRGQELTKDPSREYLEAARQAIAAVAEKERTQRALETYPKTPRTLADPEFDSLFES